MKTKDLVTSSILLALGLVLHYICPPLLFGVKPDFLLATMFISIIICSDLKSTLAIGTAAGIITAITTGMPGGQLANFIDKIITSMFFHFICIKLSKNNINVIKLSISVFLSTLLSGAIFLFIVKTMAGAPINMGYLLVTIVLPTSIFNILFSNILIKSLSMAGLKSVQTHN